MSVNYIGITIGPIYDTMQMTSSPIGLWGASYLFSYITREILQQLLQQGIKKEEILTVNFDRVEHLSFDEQEKKIKVKVKGIGLFHDRIIYKGEDLERAKIAIDKVKQLVADSFEKSLKGGSWHDYFQHYLQIHAISLCIEDNENPIARLSPYLDALELQKSFAVEIDNNPILELFNMNDKGQEDEDTGKKNKRIKDSFLIKDCGDIENCPLIYGTENHIKNIPDIALGGAIKKTWKVQSYYAVVQADGDYMGKLVTGLKDDGKIRAFSGKCFQYGIEAEEKIKEFGGVTIYAGGDDLLFLAPLFNVKNQDTLFDLVQNIEECFREVFKDEIRDADEDKKPSLSFGISVQYEKFPLYEALFCAQNLLFNEAKGVKGKNALAIRLQKHSGRSFGMIISSMQKNEIYKEWKGLLKSQQEDYWLRSVSTKLREFEPLFLLALQQEELSVVANAFNNLFDHDVHVAQKKYLEKIKTIVFQLHMEKNIQSIQKYQSDDVQQEPNKTLLAVDDLLTIWRFFSEKSSDEGGR